MSSAARPIKVGILTEATGSHLSLFLSSLAVCEGVSGVAVADPAGAVFDRARTSFAGRPVSPELYRDYSQLLREFRPDLTIVTLEPHRMPAALRLAVDNKGPVLSDKHPCVQFEDFERIAAQAAARRQLLMLALATRFHPLVQKARQLVASGEIGKVYSATIDMISDQARMWKKDFKDSWKAKRSTAGGGHLLAVGIHYVDLCRYVLGDAISRVHGFSRNVGGSPVEVEDANAVILEMAGGAVATLQSGCYLEKGFENRLQLWGSKGWIRFSVQPGASLEWYSEDGAVRTMRDESGYFDHEYLPLVQAAVNAARGMEASPVTIADGVGAVKAVFAVYDAARTGKAQQVG